MLTYTQILEVRRGRIVDMHQDGQGSEQISEDLAVQSIDKQMLLLLLLFVIVHPKAQCAIMKEDQNTCKNLRNTLTSLFEAEQKWNQKRCQTGDKAGWTGETKV